MALYVIDTNVYVSADRDLAWAEELERFSTAYLPFIHFHAVVAQELLAGAIDQRRDKLVEESLLLPFERRGRVLVPSFAAWKGAGRILSQLVQRKLMSPGGYKRSFLNDCVLAASCREVGATLITLNREGFELIRQVLPFEFSEPWPE
jgi:predicted nucleic acid-binding protein